MSRPEYRWFLSVVSIFTLLGTRDSISQAQTDTSTVTPPPGLTIEALDSMARLPGDLSALPPPTSPPGNPQTQSKIELGRELFFDKRLSNDKTISCATCHDPSKSYSDGLARGVGINHAVLSRRTPSLLNSAYNSAQFWDGRAKSLEDQSLEPMVGANEMGLPNRQALLARVRSVPEYRGKFRLAFDQGVNLQNIERALAAFERTLTTPDSAFDRYAAGDKHTLTDQQKRGLILFIGKGACSECHNGPNFTDNKFHSLGLLPGKSEESDPGHYTVTRKSADRHAFKTPSLRSVAQQSYFMHDGSMIGLNRVIQFYDDGGGKGPKSELLFRLGLTDSEEEDLIAFLKSLAGRQP